MEAPPSCLPLPGEGDRGPFLDSFLPSYRPLHDRARRLRPLPRAPASRAGVRATRISCWRGPWRIWTSGSPRPELSNVLDVGTPTPAATALLRRRRRSVVRLAPIPERGAALGDEAPPLRGRAFRSRRVAARPSGRERPARSAPADPPGAEAGRALRRLPPRRATLTELRQSFMAAESEIEAARAPGGALCRPARPRHAAAAGRLRAPGRRQRHAPGAVRRPVRAHARPAGDGAHALQDRSRKPLRRAT